MIPLALWYLSCMYMLAFYAPSQLSGIPILLFKIATVVISTYHSLSASLATILVLWQVHTSILDSPSVCIAGSVTSLVAVPALLVLSYRAWNARCRTALPHWRNGIGLAAVSLLAIAWLWFAIGLADTSLTLRFGAMSGGLTVLAVICTWLAAVFGSAWRGLSRLEVLAACLLMFVGWRFFGFS